MKPESKKNDRIYIRLNKDQKEKIEKKAEKLGMSIGVYLRFLGLNVDYELNTKSVGQKLYSPYKEN
jgi:hypothetical protein